MINVRKISIDIILLCNLQTLFRFHPFFHNILSLVQEAIQDPILHLFILSPQSLQFQSGTRPLSSFVYVTGIFLKWTGQLFYRSFLSWVCLMLKYKVYKI